MKVLIVDDSEIIREAIEVWMEPLGHTVVGRAANGKEALDLFKIHTPDLVTLDITMPELDGLSAMGEMLAVNPNAKIIIISALAAKEIALSAIRKGATSYLVKPFTEEELQDVIREAMGA